MAFLIKMHFFKSSVIIGIATIVKILAGLLVIKIVALNLGAEGLGKIGQFMSLLTIFTVISAGGILSGVTKYTAEFADNLDVQKAYLQMSILLISISSFIIMAIFIVFSVQISNFLFLTNKYSDYIIVTAILQNFIGFGYFFLSIINGHKDILTNALVLIVSYITGLIVFVCFAYVGTFPLIIIGLGVFYSFIIFPSSYFIFKKGYLNKSILENLKINFKIIKKLLKYTIMALVTIFAVQIVQILLRNYISLRLGWDYVGYWQGIVKVSETYGQFVSILLSAYLLPTLSKQISSYEIKKNIHKTLFQMAILSFLLLSLAYLMREYLIIILFSKEFIYMEQLFLYQFIGDFFKVLLFVFGYLIIAKSLMVIYIVVEIIQGILFYFLSIYMIDKFNIIGITYSYAITYFVLFVLTYVLFLLSQKHWKVGI